MLLIRQILYALNSQDFSYLFPKIFVSFHYLFQCGSKYSTKGPIFFSDSDVSSSKLFGIVLSTLTIGHVSVFFSLCEPN